MRQGRQGRQGSFAASAAFAALLVPQLFCEPDDAVERLLDAVRRRGVAQSHPPVVSERRPWYERHAAARHEAGAEVRPTDPPEGIHAEEEVERTERLHELAAGEILPEPVGRTSAPAS